MDVLALLLLGLFFVLIVPILAIYTYVRMLEQRRELRHLSEHATSRLYALEDTVRRLEQQLAGTPPRETLGTTADPATPAPGVQPPPAGLRQPAVPPDAAILRPLPAAPAAAAAAPPRRSERVDWESMIAGQWLNLVGIAALLLAVGFFLRYAFENEWIGPSGRIAMGLLGGIALLVTSERLFHAGYRFFSEGLAGLGGGVLYLSLYAAWSYYALLPQAAAFGGMTVVTVALMLLAAGRRSERIALVALAGGFSAPVLLSRGTDQYLVLFSYVAALDAGALALSHLRRWKAVDAVAFAGTQVLFWGWYFTYWTPERLVPTLFFATLFFLLFAAAAFERLRRAARSAPHLVLVLSNAFAYLFALRAALWPTHRWTLTAVVLGLAAAHLVVARIAVPAQEARVVPLVRLVYAGLALLLATLAVAIRLDGRWITIAWAVEGAILVWSGFAVPLRWLRLAGLALLGIAAVRLIAFIPAGAFLANPRFVTMATVGLCLLAAAWFAHRHGTGRREGYLFLGAAVAAHVLLVSALTTEVWEWIRAMDQPLDVAAWQLAELAIRLLWIVYGTALVLTGLAMPVQGLRWIGLPLVGVAVGALLVQDARVSAVLLNPRFAVFAAATLSVAAIGSLARRTAAPVPDAERLVYRGIPVVVGLMLLVGLSHEVWDLFALVRTPGDVRYAQTMGLSIFWAAYATAVIVAGVRTGDPSLRWMALGLFGIVVVKVFFFDLGALDRGYRILSFFVLGVLLLAVSFLYTRKLAAARGGESA